MANDKTQKKNRLTHMISSFILAIVIWAMVAYATDPDVTKTLHNLNVRFKGVQTLKDRNLIVTDISSIPDLSVKVSGKRSNMIDTIDKIVVEVDLSGITEPGKYELPGTVIVPNSRINQEKTHFDTVPVVIDEYAEKDIPIEVRQTGVFKNKLVKSEANADTVKISGAKKEIDEVAGGYVSISLDSIKGDGDIKTTFVMTDNMGNLITRNETIETPQSEITVTNTVYEPVQLPIKLSLGGDLAHSYLLDESSSETAPQALLVGVLPGFSFEYVEAELDTLDQADSDYTLTAPEGMYIPEPNIKINAKLYSQATVERSIKVDVINLGEGLKTSNEVWIDCRLHGDYSSASHITAFVDAADLTEGVYNLPVKFSGENAYPDGEYFVDISIVR